MYRVIMLRTRTVFGGGGVCRLYTALGFGRAEHCLRESQACSAKSKAAPGNSLITNRIHIFCSPTRRVLSEAHRYLAQPLWRPLCPPEDWCCDSVCIFFMWTCLEGLKLSPANIWKQTRNCFYLIHSNMIKKNWGETFWLIQIQS